MISFKRGGLTAIASFLLSIPSMVLAAPANIGSVMTGLDQTAGKEYKQASNTNISSVIGNIVNVLTAFAGTLMFVMMIYAGFKYMTAGENTNAATDARQIVQNAIVGIAIITAAYAIVNFILSQLATAATGGTVG